LLPTDVADQQRAHRAELHNDVVEERADALRVAQAAMRVTTVIDGPGGPRSTQTGSTTSSR
jgi:hypothetical protein